jgi:hypothetical protein
MSRTLRDKFLAHLNKTMVHGETATERTAAMKLFNDMTSGMPDGNYSGDIALPDLPAKLERTPSEFDETVEHAMRSHFAPQGLFCLLMLVQPPEWLAGLWSETAAGWVNKRANDKLLGWDAARQLVAARIKELGLDADKVWAYPQSHCSWQDDQTFHRMTFETQMSQFK